MFCSEHLQEPTVFFNCGFVVLVDLLRGLWSACWGMLRQIHQRPERLSDWVKGNPKKQRQIEEWIYSCSYLVYLFYPYYPLYSFGGSWANKKIQGDARWIQVTHFGSFFHETRYQHQGVPREVTRIVHLCYWLMTSVVFLGWVVNNPFSCYEWKIIISRKTNL